MWELICHHQYCWGTIAADRSPWHSDGFVTDVAPLAGEPGLRFSTPQSRIVIPRKAADAWRVMRAIRVEIVASSLQGGGTLIDADQCFRVRFDGPQKIVVDILGKSLEYEIEGLPVGNWVSFQFSHDGVNALTHGYGYTLASGLGEGAGGGSAQFVPGQVPAVGPQGVWFGNRIGSPASHLNGNIQSIKIWRADPKTIIKKFLDRPLSPPLLKCWGDFLHKINEVSSKDPDCVAWLARVAEQMQSGFFQRLAQKSPEKIAEFWDLCAAYQKLWAAGKVGSDEMKDLAARLRDWLKSENLFSTDDPDILGVFENPCMKNLTGAVGGLDCDADAQTLLKAILGA